MSRDDSLSHYNKSMELSPESTNEEIREVYSKWHKTFDKVRTKRADLNIALHNQQSNRCKRARHGYLDGILRQQPQ